MSFGARDRDGDGAAKSLSVRSDAIVNQDQCVNKLTAMPTDIHWNAGMPVFASEAFLKSVSRDYGWIGGADASGQLRCILPYTVIHKLGVRIIRFRGETVPLAAGFEVEEEKSFLNSTVEYLRGVGADMIIPASNNSLFRTYPDGALAAPYGTIINDLQQPEEALWAGVATDFRQNIRKAAKNGVQIKRGKEYLDSSYDLVAETLARSGMKFRSRDEFKAILGNLDQNVEIFVAEAEGVIQACMVAPFSLHSAYDWYSGTIAKPLRGAMHALLWESLLYFQKRGVRKFNFTGVRINPEKGSKQEGILNFKMRFGGSLVQGYIWKYSFNRLKFAAYSVARRLWLGGDVFDSERQKNRQQTSVAE